MNEASYKAFQDMLLGQCRVLEMLFSAEDLSAFVTTAERARSVGWISTAPHDYLRAEERLAVLVELAGDVRRIRDRLAQLRAIILRQEPGSVQP